MDKVEKIVGYHGASFTALLPEMLYLLISILGHVKIHLNPKTKTDHENTFLGHMAKLS